MNDIRNEQNLSEEEFLKQYDPSRYERPSVTVDMLIFALSGIVGKKEEKSLQILLIKRGGHPFLGHWALPGGFVSIDESIDDAALRELKEETGLDGVYMQQLYTWGDVDRDPRTRVISCSYIALVDKSSLKVKAGSDAREAKWFSVKDKVLEEQKERTQRGYIHRRYTGLELISEEDRLSAVVKVTRVVENGVKKIKREIVENRGIAFDHAKIILYGIENLRNRIIYTDIAFNLMPEKFTLTELCEVYEIILNRKLSDEYFTRKIAKMVIETDEYKEGTNQKLYRYNPDWENKFLF